MEIDVPYTFVQWSSSQHRQRLLRYFAGVILRSVLGRGRGGLGRSKSNMAGMILTLRGGSAGATVKDNFRFDARSPVQAKKAWAPRLCPGVPVSTYIHYCSPYTQLVTLSHTGYRVVGTGTRHIDGIGGLPSEVLVQYRKDYQVPGTARGHIGGRGLKCFILCDRRII